MAAPAAPPALSGSVSNAQCDQYTNGEGNAALCGPVFQTTFALTAQANNINSNVDGILKTVNEAIGANGNAVTEILQTGTLGLVSTLADGAGVSLYGLATTLNNLVSTFTDACIFLLGLTKGSSCLVATSMQV